MPLDIKIFSSVPTNTANVVVDLANVNFEGYTPEELTTIGLKLSGLNQLGTPANNLRIKLICSDVNKFNSFIGAIQVILPKISTMNYRNSQYVIDCTDASLDTLIYRLYFVGYYDWNSQTFAITNEEFINGISGFPVQNSRVAVVDLVTPEQWSTDTPLVQIR